MVTSCHSFDVSDTAFPDHSSGKSVVGSGDTGAPAMAEPSAGLAPSPPPSLLRPPCRPRRSAVGYVQAADAVHGMCLTAALTPLP